jgi:hypothetical protein
MLHFRAFLFTWYWTAIGYFWDILSKFSILFIIEVKESKNSCSTLLPLIFNKLDGSKEEASEWEITKNVSVTSFIRYW